MSVETHRRTFARHSRLSTSTISSVDTRKRTATRHSRSTSSTISSVDTMSATPESPRLSSSDLSFDSDWFPADPLQPSYPLPERVRTPPGLPSFGTKQATLLRLEQRRSRRAASRACSWLNSHEESSEHAVAGRSPNSTAPPQRSPVSSPPLLPRSLPDRVTKSRELFRRTLAEIGFSRMHYPRRVKRVSSPQQNSPSIQASSSSYKLILPPWVYMTNDPGPLAQADDGTFMRGTFGARSSGHGIGARDIDALPLARLAKRPPMPPHCPATLASLRRMEAATGQSSVGAIGAAEEVRAESEEKGRRACDVCCDKFAMWCTVD